jgi:phenylacetate-coenzyme A ligase PaaK-like adenylate-forming protein
MRIIAPERTRPQFEVQRRMLDPHFWLDLIAAMTLRRRRLRAVERAPRAVVLDLQRRRLAALLEHAARHSCFYRQRWRGRVPRPEELVDLQPVDKRTLLHDRFDDAVTLPGLTLTRARERLRTASERQRGEWIAVTTSGSTGEPVVVPFSRRDWRLGMAGVLRSAGLVEATVRASRVRRGSGGGLRTAMHALRRRPRVAGVSTLHPNHVSSQLGASFRCGLVPSLQLAASAPIEEQVGRLQRFDPTVIGAYPSALEPLVGAAEQGELDLSPDLVFTGGETVTASLRRRVRAAWDADIFDFYGLTETLIIAGECDAHAGMHLFEDLVVLEVVDEAGRVLPPGERGAGILLTSLVNRTLPIIRYQVSDLVMVTDEPCACGLPYARLTAVDGRREELLPLRRDDGATVLVHPFVIETPLEELDEVRRFEVAPDDAGHVRITIVAAAGIDTRLLPARVRDAVGDALAPIGVPVDDVRVELAATLVPRRGSTDKLLRSPAPTL